MAHDTEPKTTVWTAIQKATDAIGVVTKGATNKHFDFTYQGWDDLVPVVKKACVDAGLLILTNVVKYEDCHVVAKFSGEHQQRQPRIRVWLEIVFVDSATGDSTTVKFIGEAIGMDDKGMNKAITSGLKYAYIKLFQIAVKGMVDDSDGGDGTAGTGDAPTAPKEEPKAKAKPEGPVVFGFQTTRTPNERQWKEEPTDKQRKAMYGKAADHDIDKTLVPFCAAACAGQVGHPPEYETPEGGATVVKVTKGACMIALSVMGDDDARAKMIEAAKADDNYDPFDD